MNKLALTAMTVVLALSGAPVVAQDAPAAPPPAAPAAAAPAPARPGPPALGDGPWDVASADAKLRVEVVTKGLDHPWGMAFLPDGSILVTERPGRLRVVRDGVLDPEPVAGLPAMWAPGIAGLTDVVIDPEFASNGLIYLAYSKADPAAGDKPGPATNATI